MVPVHVGDAVLGSGQSRFRGALWRTRRIQGTLVSSREPTSRMWLPRSTGTCPRSWTSRPIPRAHYCPLFTRDTPQAGGNGNDIQLVLGCARV